ncbi:Mismatch repair protein msh3 [Gryganskiella cystojenkinii]|nr:Mismatch repair protein msh3 [Gryganskiella cystojenkinii]
MATDKELPVRSQKTLLSFFKPAPGTTVTTSAPVNNNAEKVTPTKSTTKDVPPTNPSKTSRTAKPLPPSTSQTTNRSTQRKPSTRQDSDHRDSEDSSLLPLGPLNGDQDSLDEVLDETKASVSTTKNKRTETGMLSRFQYAGDTADTSKEDDPKDYLPVDQSSASTSRQEAFRQKIGFLTSPSTSVSTSPSASSLPAATTTITSPKRRRLIVSEDEDEDDDDPDEHLEPKSTISLKKSTTSTASSKSKVGQQSGSKKVKSVYTPLEKQYMEIKEQYPDAILCIEVGYKFRFFGKDAEIASKELSIMHFMDHNFYTASIPVPRLDVHVRRLVHAGYKVGVVRQMETAALKSAGDNKSAPFTRKLTNLYTKATFIESLERDEDQFGSQEPSSQYIMCICEQPQGGSGPDERVLLAIIAVQPATGDIIYDEFVDGHFRNELETRLLHIQPTELIIPMASMSKSTEKIIKSLSASRRSVSLNSGQDDVRIERTDGFLKYDKAFTLVSEFYARAIRDGQQKESKTTTLGPHSHQSKGQAEELLKTVLGLSRNLIIVLAAMISHLSDFGLAPVFHLSKYFECFTSRSHMLLNGNTIANLEIYRNQTDWSSRGSLFSILDHTMTGFGRRLLKKWVGKPLVDRNALQERVDAVEEILSQQGKNELLESTKVMLKGLLDLEKGVCRIHYGKSTPKEFLTILKTFTEIAKVTERADRMNKGPDYGLTSPVLRRLIGSLSKAQEESKYFVGCLDEQAALKDDKLQMFQADTLDEKWPEILQHKNNIVVTEAEFVEHLGEIRKLLREPRLEFTSVSGIDYLIETKNKDVTKIPKSWIKVSGTKQVSRFHAPETIRLIQEKAQHQERLVMACDQAFKVLQQEFSDQYEIFRDVVQSLAMLDCLLSLATVACLPGYIKPEYVDDHHGSSGSERSEKEESHTTIEIKNGRHPMVEQLVSPGTFVPNNVQFGLNPTSNLAETSILLTGPNMGGKSCYIRQVALLCIMAQIGSYIPADSARVSMLDAVYTRMGASDNIFGHESTFMVELQETSDILKMASKKSLVILDELGRGTSTLDGVAIAYAVLKHVVDKIGAITLFVTHYPSLAEVATEFPEGRIRNFHMGFMATSSGSSASISFEKSPATDSKEECPDDDIVFLYKLMPGVSLKSYGLNVARMAKLPQALIDRARTKSKDLELMLERRVQRKRKRREETAEAADNDESMEMDAVLEVSDRQSQLTQKLKQIMVCQSQEEANDLRRNLENHTEYEK